MGRVLLRVLLAMAWLGPAVADDAALWPVGNAETMWQPDLLPGSFRHWDAIYPVRVVAAGPETSALPQGDPLEIGAFWMDSEEMDLDRYIERAHVTGLLVIQGGTIRLEAYGLGADESSTFISHSMAKSVVSTLVGLALGDGLIASLDDPVDRYVPELAASAYAGVPIEAILQMSSGIGFIEAYESLPSDSYVMWRTLAVEHTTDAHAYLLGLTAEQPPYADFNYKGPDTLVLGWLVEAVTGESLSANLSRRLWQPLGMEADGNWGLDGTGPGAHELAFCCLSARLRDWGRFGLLMARDGVWQGERLLPDGWVQRATVPSRDQVMPGRLFPGYPLGYQYQWWTLPGNEGVFRASGVHGQYIHVDPARDLVIVQTAAWPRPLKSVFEQGFNYLVKAITAATDAE